MSRWTHITACFSVDTFKDSPKSEIRKYANDILKKAPKITGSEGNAQIYINVQRGYNISSIEWVSDCKNCEYRDSHKIYKKDNETYEECDAPEDTCIHEKREITHHQSCLVISVQGDLRDRMVEQTQEEFDKFLEYVKNHFYIRDFSMNIEQD